jgi:HAMP domain-containing protein
MQAQIAKEVEVQQLMKRERDVALDEVAALKGTVEKLTQARADATAKQAGAQQALKRERDSALDEVAALKGTVEELTQAREHAEARTVELSQRLRKVRQSKAQEIARSIGAAFSPFVIAAAVATVGFWTYQLVWSAPQPLPAVAIHSTPEAKTAELEAKLTSAETEQQRLRDEVGRQTKAFADADAKRRTAEAEQQRLTAALSQSTPAATNRLFDIRRNMEAKPRALLGSYLGLLSVRSMEECEQKCAQSESCSAFSLYNKTSGTERQCYLYRDAELAPNSDFDSGVRK